MKFHCSRYMASVFLVIIVCVTVAAKPLKYEKRVVVPASLIQQLFDLTSSEQAKEDQPFNQWKLQWRRDKGVYNNVVKLYFHGDPELSVVRRLGDMVDNNMFVTVWVTSLLLEAYRYGRAPRPSDEQLIMALNSLLEYKDKNKDYETSVMAFWPIAYNETAEYWQSTPENIRILETLGLGKVVKYADKIIMDSPLYLKFLHIPPDFDCTFVNVGLGSLLYQMKDEFPKAWNLWNSHNTNLTSVFDALKRYAYRPFSSDHNANTIDPRTYFYMREFLDDAAAKGKDLALVPTWAQNIEELQTEYYKGVAMPNQMNNVDVTVCANIIYGITASVLSGLVSPYVLKDPELAQIYENTSSLIAHEIYANISSRPDLALLYYPSQIEFYWFVSRTVSLMEEAKKKGPLPVAVMETVYNTLKKAVTGPMTEHILSEGRYGRSRTIYYDDFMGNGDFTRDNRTLNRAEDRIYTTAMAANALLYTWTEFDDSTRKVQWKKDVSDAVKQYTHSTVKWLVNHSRDERYDPWNPFFSAATKGFDSLPFWYPFNIQEHLNGEAIQNSTEILADGIYAVQGHIPPEKYNAMLKEKRFGKDTPLDFKGYNNEEGYFPLWSSVPYTYSTTMLALSTFSNIGE